MSEPTPLEFVPLARDHIEAIMSIELEAYPDPWTQGMFLDELRNPRSRFYVVFHGPTLVGYGGFWLVLDEAHITSVTIRREDRGRGWGRRLFTFLLERAMAEDAKTATLEVRRSNAAAQKLYHSMGFTLVGVRKGYYPRSGEDAVVMLKELVPTRPEPGRDQ